MSHILTQNWKHRGVCYKFGINEDLTSNDVFYTTSEFLPQLLQYNDYIAEVHAADNSTITVGSGGNKWKSNKLLVDKVYPISELKQWSDTVFCLAAINHDPRLFEYVKEQTEEICLAAVKQNGLMLKFVKNQTEEICLAAVRQNGFAIQYVKNPTVELTCIASKQICG